VIQVLQNKSQYEQAMALLKSRGLPLHITPQKNWDHQRVMELAESLDKAAPILDMGSGDGFTLAMLHELGYQNLAGVDYTVCKPNLRARLKHLFNPPKFKPHQIIRQGDLCQTGLDAESFDLLTCISVVEHGVDLPAFLTEARRLLKPGGRLLVTTDYWHDIADDATAEHRIFDLPWTVFNRDRVAKMIEIGNAAGLDLIEPTHAVPAGDEPTVQYLGFDYTFIAVGFCRSNG